MASAAGHNVESQSGLPTLQKKLAEVELGLLQLQHNAEIPQVFLTLHPAILDVLVSSARTKSSPSINLLDPETLRDSTFHNALGATTNGWITEIQLLRNASRSTHTGTTMQEIRFWSDLENLLEDVDGRLKGEGIQLTLQVLDYAKRRMQADNLRVEAGEVKRAIESIRMYNYLLKDIPLDQLLSATRLDEARNALDSIFAHITRRFRNSGYPVERGLALMEGISSDMNAKFHDIVSGRTLMRSTQSEFDGVIHRAEALWLTWDDHINNFTDIAREATRKRSQKFVFIKVEEKHAATKQRLRHVEEFRKSHRLLENTIQAILDAEDNDPMLQKTKSDELTVARTGGVNVAAELKRAYDVISSVDALDLSEEGTHAWNQAEMNYNELISRVETSIVNRLREQLALAEDARSMFGAFSRFSSILARPKIRGAVTDYQHQLLEHVKNDVLVIQERLRLKDDHDPAQALARLHDISPVSRSIIWARQMGRQLDTVMRRVADVLGPQWNMHTEGRQLQDDVAAVRKKLDTDAIFRSWVQDVEKRDTRIRGPLLSVALNRSASTMELTVNFDLQVITLFKEARNLAWLQFVVPFQIYLASRRTKSLYPLAMSLVDSTKALAQITESLRAASDVTYLLNRDMHNVQSLIKEGLRLHWDDGYEEDDHDCAYAENQGQFTQNFALGVSSLQKKANVVLVANDTLQKSLSNLRKCSFQAKAFRNELAVIQEIADRLSLEGVVNQRVWVQRTNDAIHEILAERLNDALDLWIESFESTDANAATKDVGAAADGTKSDDEPSIEHISFELSMRNSTIDIEPSLEFAKCSWIENLQLWISSACDLGYVRPSRFDFAENIASNVPPLSAHNLLYQCASKLASAYMHIEKAGEKLSSYIGQWSQYQALWDLQPDFVYNQLADDLARWLELVHEIRSKRSTFDTTETMRSFAHATIDYRQVQNRINKKYDDWQRDIDTKFAMQLEPKIRTTVEGMDKIRRTLEGLTMETASTTQAVLFVTTVQNAKRQAVGWSTDLEVFRRGQAALYKNRYKFPVNWIRAEHMDHGYAALIEILQRKEAMVVKQTGHLRLRITSEEEVLTRRMNDLTSTWNSSRPASGNVAIDQALEMLNNFELSTRSLSEELEQIYRAKEALNLPALNTNNALAILDEIEAFKAVYAALATIWKTVDDLRAIKWQDLQPRKLRQSLEALTKDCKDLPTRMRQYAAFEQLQSYLRMQIKTNPLVADLRSDSLKDRHWAQLHKALRSTKPLVPTSLRLGDVWELQLAANEKQIRDIILQAQGEANLEEYLKQLKETWQNYSLEFVNYRNRCRLIRGWEEIFSKCSEHLNALQTMRHSPYYKIFETEANSWAEKLNDVHFVFDIWVEVQRTWVHLEGIFSGNKDIKHLLPLESARFQTIDSEFLGLMRKAQRSPFVLEVVAISGVQKSLERLSELLSRVQKALGEYLEKERALFPRFYFVGDEDLLEILSNSQDVTGAAPHLKKMFAGISGLTVNENQDIISFNSAQGEVIALSKAISLKDTPKASEWLSELENGMRNSLASQLGQAVSRFGPMFQDDSAQVVNVLLEAMLSSYPAQIIVLAGQVWWTSSVENALHNGSLLSDLLEKHQALLRHLAALVVTIHDSLRRNKCEQLITEFVFQRNVIETLLLHKVDSLDSHEWQLQLRYYLKPAPTPSRSLEVRMANATFEYGFEYLGVTDRLIRTPLTERCFLTMAQALSQQLGGSPYGPAGTGKTETVKALGAQLGRLTIVFCCDDTFDFRAIERILLGICQVGAWGCFDEFNRLEEKILSAVSQQIQNIQRGLRSRAQNSQQEIDLLGRKAQLHADAGIFITMNPGYAGRSNLPDNLKKLFRSVAMSKPDKELIAEVTLYSQGFEAARDISSAIVPVFEACATRMSSQLHYDFGLRALKGVLISSGRLKRASTQQSDSDSMRTAKAEFQIMLQSLRETIDPKLVENDLQVLRTIELEFLPDVFYVAAPLVALREAICKVLESRHLLCPEAWIAKALQLFQIQQLHHGVMMVGASGTGKSSTWTVLLEALRMTDGIEGVSYVIDPKVVSKETLFGSLDPTTREWTDGIFTSILRRIIENMRGEESRRHWIVFDGDVDPDWIENLNSVLDDNKILTLPNGERLVLPPNVKILFEVDSLRFATPATVSRCGMVWFDDHHVVPEMMVQAYLSALSSLVLETRADDNEGDVNASAEASRIQAQIVVELRKILLDDGVLDLSLQLATTCTHVMSWTSVRALETLFALLNQMCRQAQRYQSQYSDLPLDGSLITSFLRKRLALALAWGFVGDCRLADRQIFCTQLSQRLSLDLPESTAQLSLIDFNVRLPDADWIPWQSHVPSLELDATQIEQTDVVIPTVDTVRHEDIIYGWLAEHKPLLLCGPPGSGKTMTLFSALRKLPEMDVVGLNFSSATSPDLILRSLEQHCEYRKTTTGIMLTPRQSGRRVVFFCDEINLPARDAYGTQRVIAFMRQLISRSGYWRPSDKVWVSLDRIQFVGACNPPTDAGRVPLSLRFLRYTPLVMVDYPGPVSLSQIYNTMNQAVLKTVPNLRGYASALTESMIDVYTQSQDRLTQELQSHYIYSPRELTRWVKGIHEAIKPLEHLDLNALARLWVHEALRLFYDRLVHNDERTWTMDMIMETANKHFPSIEAAKALSPPFLYSNWISRHYLPVNQAELRDFVKARLRTFCEEEVDIPLVLYDDALDHVLRIDRVFRQPQGHVILIGTSGSGKTTLSRFVAWMNGLSIYQLRVHRRYSAADFDEDLRTVLRRCGCRGERICFILDEANIMDSAFLERMNTLLANGEVPGLFEADDYAALMTACREGSQAQGLILDSQEELYKWFTQQIVKNLHIVFTMNPPVAGLSGRAAASPALFNRCVINWFGDWSGDALYQIGSELTQSMDLDNGSVPPPASPRKNGVSLSCREATLRSIVYVHASVVEISQSSDYGEGRTAFTTPRHYLDFVSQFIRLCNEKREQLQNQQRHLNTGLEKLTETVNKVRDLRKNLAGKKIELERKDNEANEKLQGMLVDQQQAERRRAASYEVQAAIDRQEKEVAERRQKVMIDLANVEPAVLSAKESVSNIKKQQLTEVRSMGSPPAGVKLALESVCVLLGHKVDSWKTIQSIVRRDDFIASIVNYDNEQHMTATHRQKMYDDYLSLEDYTYERVNRASKACGPLVQWVQAQVNFSEILDRVGPLREEVSVLEDQALQSRAEAKAIEMNITDIERRIANYKSEYATLISQTQAIKDEMLKVEKKVERSLHLLDSLAGERRRWSETNRSFDAQNSTLIGDALLAAAFMAYAGPYDEQYRAQMLASWSEYLTTMDVKFTQDMPALAYSSNVDERLEWQRGGLPGDDLSIENAIMLKRYNRYPLVVDPAGKIVDFIERQHRGKHRLIITSFLDSNFTKQLESALRFGNALLVQDADQLDPVLNPILNREYQKTGGRTLVQLGKQDIDFSPNFKLFLTSKNSTARFGPDTCSRVTMINFSITQSGLESQSLMKVLKSERPDVDERRSNLLRMQGEFDGHLRRLEKQLLEAISESEGSLLDNDAVVQKLENVKSEAAIITAKAAEASGVMSDLHLVAQQYELVARSCTAIYAVLQQLHLINRLYQFSLQYFVGIFESVLTYTKSLSETTGQSQRVDLIIKHLFCTIYRSTSLSLFSQDRPILALLLVQASPVEMNQELFSMLVEHEHNDSAVEMTVNEIQDLLERINAATDDLRVSDCARVLAEDHAETEMFALLRTEDDSIDGYLKALIVLKSRRRDRLVPAIERLITRVFGDAIYNDSETLSQTIDQVSASIPVALCSTPGFDASQRVEDLARTTATKCTSVAMGSPESIAAADKAMADAAAVGTWVLIKNVHLALDWLGTLEKKLELVKPSPGFRLFLSMECTPSLPLNPLRHSRILVCEQPAGLRANLKDSLRTTPPPLPLERARLHLLLALLHAIAQERLLHAPALGWRARWEFDAADRACAARAADACLDAVARGRANVGPEGMPWRMMRALVVSAYGGKVEEEGDYARLERLVEGLLVPEAYEEGFDVARAVARVDGAEREGEVVEPLVLPAGTGWEGFARWVDGLPERDPPGWLGLPRDADRVLLAEWGMGVLAGVGRAREGLKRTGSGQVGAKPRSGVATAETV